MIGSDKRLEIYKSFLLSFCGNKFEEVEIRPFDPESSKIAWWIKTLPLFFFNFQLIYLKAPRPQRGRGKE